jgi:hypothetical protein
MGGVGERWRNGGCNLMVKYNSSNNMALSRLSTVMFLTVPVVYSLILPDGVVSLPSWKLPSASAYMQVQGRLPALGWNSWNAYHCDVSEDKILAAANQMVDLGLKDVGYEYVNSMHQTSALQKKLTVRS